MRDPEQRESARRAALRVRRFVVSLGGVVNESTPDGDVLQAELPDWPAVLDLATYMALDAAEYSTSIVQLARDLRTVARVVEWVQQNVEWRDEPGERLTYPTDTLDVMAGDCDDSNTLVASLTSALGYPSAVVGCTLDGVPVHGVAAVQMVRGPHGWFWADGSEDIGLRPWHRHPLTSDGRPGRRGIIRPRMTDVPDWG